MQDREGELDTLRKAGKNLRERLDEKEVETRGIMDRVSLLQEKACRVPIVISSRPPRYVRVPVMTLNVCVTDAAI